MMSFENKPWYKAWRRREAHMIPMTQDGMEAANVRAEEFKKGFDAGLKYASSKLEMEHSKVKKDHSFFYKASRIVREMI